MKRKFAKRALSGLLSLLMVLGLLPLTAMAEGIPEYITPVYPATSDGVTVEAVKVSGGYDLIVTIAEGTDAENLNVNLGNAFDDDVLPGMYGNFNIKIVNNSGCSYGYADNSLILGTAPYNLSIEDDQNPDNWEQVSAFDGFTVYIDSYNDVTRSYNNALKALDIGLDGSSTNSEINKALSDANLSERLKSAGYNNGIADLGQYYIDYYNKTYGASISDLKEADLEYQRNLFSCMRPGGFGQHNNTGIRETCPKVAELGYYYLYNHLVTINDEPLATYMEKDSTSLAKLNGEFQEALAVPAGETGIVTLQGALNGPDTTNCYQNHVILFNLSFVLEKGEAKQSYPGLDKQVGDDDEEMNDVDVDAAAGQKVNFQLTSNVPTDLLNYLNPEDVYPPVIGDAEPGTAENVEVDGRGEYILTFHDQLNSMLLNPTDYAVTIGGKILEAKYYTLNASPEDCSFEISLDLVALYKDKIITNEDIQNAVPIVVTYAATLSADATAGTYENTAWVTAPKWTSEKDIVSVNTYAVKIFKYDQANPETGLAGAVFTLTDGAGKEITVTSGEDGYAVIDGLDAGTYILTETKAPDGYVKSDTPLNIVIPNDADSENVVNVKFANSQIPHTGGSGTLMFTIGGVVIIAMAGVLLLASRKKKKA